MAGSTLSMLPDAAVLPVLLYGPRLLPAVSSSLRQQWQGEWCLFARVMGHSTLLTRPGAAALPVRPCGVLRQLETPATRLPLEPTGESFPDRLTPNCMPSTRLAP